MESGDFMELVEAVERAGVVGAGGAGFPTHVKLKAKAEYFLVNAAECEPLIETDKYLCRTYPDRIVSTVVKIAEHLGAKHAVIALKKKYRTLSFMRLQAELCRMCTDLCPRYLIGHEVLPHMVMRNLYKEHADMSPEEYKRCFGSAVNCCSCGICEMFSCPMGLSPRKMNDYEKQRLKEKGIQVERNPDPEARYGWKHTKIPTDRLIARLDLTKYVIHTLPEVKEFVPDMCILPLSQHIGKPASPVVEPGSKVSKGDLVAAAAEGLSANIHSGMDGVVTEVTDREIRICRKEE